MMNKQTAENILQLLQRVDLKGSEVPAFLQATQELNLIINKPSIPLEKEKKKVK